MSVKAPIELGPQRSASTKALVAAGAATMLLPIACSYPDQLGESEEAKVQLVENTDTQIAEESASMLEEVSFSESILLEVDVDKEAVEITPELEIHPEYINTSAIVSQFKKGDFTVPVYDHKRGTKIARGLNIGEIGYIADITRGKDTLLELVDRTPEGLGENEATFLKILSDQYIYLAAAFESGNLDRVEFYITDPNNEDVISFGQDTYPEYINEDYTRGVVPESVIAYRLSTDQDLSALEVSTMLRHETLHALNQNLHAKLELAPSEQKAKFVELCSSLTDVVFTQLASQSDSIALQVGEMATAVPPQYKQVFQDIAQQLLDGTLRNSVDQTSNEHYGAIPECFVKDPWLQAIDEFHSQGLDMDPLTSLVLEDESASDLYVNIRDGWSKTISSASLYSLLREGTYIEGSEYNKGHPQDGWDELVASTANSVLSFPRELGNLAKMLQDDEKELLIHTVRTVLDSLVKENPMLSQEFISREAEFLDALYG